MRNAKLALLLFMLRIFAANNHYHTMAANDLTAITTRFHWGAYFHD